MEYPLRDDAYRSRLSSYGHTFPQCGVPIEKLAEAGFRYDGTEDQVHCDYCKGCLKSWKEGDCPLTEHKRSFVHCPFLIPLLSFPKHAEYSSLSDRINTFPLGQQNDTSTHPSVKEFAECGFFSARSPHDITHTDTVTCFHCGITLARWNTDDDVWVEHAKAANNGNMCGFLIKMKGIDYVLNYKRQPRSQSSTNTAMTPSPLARELTLGASRSIGTSPIREMIRPIAIRPDNIDNIVSPLSSLSISTSYNSFPSSTQNQIHSHYQRHVTSSPIQHPTPPPPPLTPPPPPQQQPLSATPTLSERRYARMPSISTINSSSSSSALNQQNTAQQQQQLSSTQQIVPRAAVPGGSSSSSSVGRYRYSQSGQSSRRSPILVSSSARLSPYNINSRHSNNAVTSSSSSINQLNQQHQPRTPEPLPEAPADAPEEDLRRMYGDLLRQRQCKVCLSNLATVLFLPCGHLSACPACAPHLQDCHVCRTRIDSQHDIYPS